MKSVCIVLSVVCTVLCHKNSWYVPLREPKRVHTNTHFKHVTHTHTCMRTHTFQICDTHTHTHMHVHTHTTNMWHKHVHVCTLTHTNTHHTHTHPSTPTYPHPHAHTHTHTPFLSSSIPQLQNDDTVTYQQWFHLEIYSWKRQQKQNFRFKNLGVCDSNRVKLKNSVETELILETILSDSFHPLNR